MRVKPSTHGTWERLGDEGWLWRVRVSAPDAASINLGFSRYVMPPGGRLLVYAADGTGSIRPFTERDNELHGELWTPVLLTDDRLSPRRVEAELDGLGQRLLAPLPRQVGQAGKARTIPAVATGILTRRLLKDPFHTLVAHLPDGSVDKAHVDAIEISQHGRRPGAARLGEHVLEVRKALEHAAHDEVPKACLAVEGDLGNPQRLGNRTRSVVG